MPMVAPGLLQKVDTSQLFFTYLKAEKKMKYLKAGAKRQVLLADAAVMGRVSMCI